MRFQEITSDQGPKKAVTASNNSAVYILTSALAKDAYSEFISKYNRLPSSSWYNRNFRFKRV